MRCQTTREVSRVNGVVSLVDCSVKELWEETAYAAASASGAVGSWLNGPVQDKRKLDLAYNGKITLSLNAETVVRT